MKNIIILAACIAALCYMIVEGMVKQQEINEAAAERYRVERVK